jgi:hypothetical protein
VLGLKAVIQEVHDVEFFIVKEYGKAVYSGVAAFYRDGLLPSGEAGFGLFWHFRVPVLYSVVL